MIKRAAPAFQSYECQGALFHVIMNDFVCGNAVHAYLVVGDAGMGKRTFVNLAAQALICKGDVRPCQTCGPCERMRNGTHQDVLVLRREKDKATIGVDAVREVIRLAGQHTYEGGKRIVLVEEADTLTPQAQNCLLKTLEEPIADIVFFLIAKDTIDLLPTVLSRCRLLTFREWDKEYIEAVLDRKGISPEKRRLAAIKCFGNIGRAIAIAEDSGYYEQRNAVMDRVFRLKKAGEALTVGNLLKDEKAQANSFLDTVTEMLRELMLVNTGCMSIDGIKDFPPLWQDVAQGAQPSDWNKLFAAVQKARERRDNQVNWQATIEMLLLDIMEEANRW